MNLHLIGAVLTLPSRVGIQRDVLSESGTGGSAENILVIVVQKMALMLFVTESLLYFFAQKYWIFNTYNVISKIETFHNRLIWDNSIVQIDHPT